MRELRNCVAVFAQAANSPSAHFNFVETSRKEFPINVADPIFYNFVVCMVCVFVDNIEIGSSRQVFDAFELSFCRKFDFTFRVPSRTINIVEMYIFCYENLAFIVYEITY